MNVELEGLLVGLLKWFAEILVLMMLLECFAWLLECFVWLLECFDELLKETLVKLFEYLERNLVGLDIHTDLVKYVREKTLGPIKNQQEEEEDVFYDALDRQE